MAWPANQNLIPASFTHRRPQQQNTALAEKVKRQQSYGQYLEREQAPSGAGLGAAFGNGGFGEGVALDAGLEGSARLVERTSRDVKGKGRASGMGSDGTWEWAWVRGSDEESRLTLDAKQTVLFPATIARSPTIAQLPNLSTRNFPRRRTRSMISLTDPLAGKLGLMDDVVMDESVQRFMHDELEGGAGTDLDRGRRNKIPRRSSLHRSASSNNIPSHLSLDADADPDPPHRLTKSSALTPGFELPATRARELVEHRESRIAEEARALGIGNGQRLIAIKWETMTKKFGDEKGTALFLGFPMGVNGEDLNISFCKTWPEGSKKVPTFMPTHEPCMSFPTPILQISASDARGIHDATKYLAVRLYASTRIISLSLPSTFRPTRNNQTRSRHHPPNSKIPIAHEFDTITLDRTGGSGHVDVAMHPFRQGYAVLVDRDGRVWLWEKVWVPDVYHGGRHVGELRCIREADEAGSDGFWRVAWGSSEGTVIVSGAKFVDSISLEEHTHSTRRILDLTHGTSIIMSTSTDGLLRNARYLCVTTSTDVAWIDESTNSNPVMTWKHHRSNVPNLRTLSVGVPSGSATLLIASPWSAMTCFTVNEDSPVVTSALDPYYIPTSNLCDSDLDSALIFNMPGHEPADRLFIKLERAGRLLGSVLRGNTTEERERRQCAISVQWSGAIMAVAVDDVAEDVSNDDAERVNFRSLWADLQWAIFGSKDRVLNTRELKNMLEEQEDLAISGPLTILEAVALASDDPDREDRGTIFLRGFSIEDGDTSIRATTHAIFLIDSLLKRISNDTYRLDKPTKSLGRLDLSSVEQDTCSGPDNTYRSGLTKEKDMIARRLVEVRSAYARRRLLLDLRLSSAVLGGADETVGPPQVESTHDLAAFAARLQIDSGKRSTQFDFQLLNPRPSWKGVSDVTDARPGTTVLDRRNGSGTIRSLLAGWDLGSDLSDFSWVSSRGPGDGSDPAKVSTPAPSAPQPQPARLPPRAKQDQAQSQPVVSRHPPSTLSQAPRMLEPHPSLYGIVPSPDAGSHPPDMPNTQSVPGRFGSRMGGGRIAPSSQGLARKRAFGF